MHESLVLKETFRSVEGLMLEKASFIMSSWWKLILALLNILVGVCIIYNSFCMYSTSVCEY